MNEHATKVFERLPKDGSKVGGITLQRELDLSKVEFKHAKQELVEAGLIGLGQGRGGSVYRTGKEPTKVVSHAERLEAAREIKSARSMDLKDRDEIRARVTALVKKQLGVDIEDKHISLYGMHLTPMVEIKGQMHQVTEALL